MLNLKVIYQDTNFLVIDKPAGLLVHPTKYQKEGTLVETLRNYFPEIKEVGETGREGIVHRLDQDVSGLMVIAKIKRMYEHLVKQFQSGKVEKKYLALVYGRPPQENYSDERVRVAEAAGGGALFGCIDLPIARTSKGKIIAVKYRKKIKFEKPAKTYYKTLQKFKEYTLLEVQPLTGRTHQIRVHLKAINCPIVGDKRYAKIKNKKEKIPPNFSFEKLRRAGKNNLDRPFLHASYLGFYDLNGRWREFRSELPEELKNFLVNLN